ncbi:hypothetical protein [Pseudomonas fragi]|uniref:hypothetical protein n=1 Tax=Pseudomonas fragi TaxID=296 RepID=UPI0014729C89|nr:hypothetical protein [Pseudomonas fragi]NNB15198.1 hypothetical protein [Pseudomonas fragi]NNB22451.1 hypothetical protein [Pseudomonas fragi]
MTDQKEVLEMILTAEVLALAAALKAEKLSRSNVMGYDGISDAVRLIKSKRASILEALTRP